MISLQFNREVYVLSHLSVKQKNRFQGTMVIQAYLSAPLISFGIHSTPKNDSPCCMYKIVKYLSSMINWSKKMIMLGLFCERKSTWKIDITIIWQQRLLELCFKFLSCFKLIIMTCHLVNNSSLIRSDKRKYYQNIGDKLLSRYATLIMRFYILNSNYYLFDMWSLNSSSSEHM